MIDRREVLALLGAAGLASCRPSPRPGGVTIALVTQETESAYARALQAGANEAAKQIGGTTLVFQGPPRATVEAQIEVVNALTAQQVDAIAISALDPDALAPALKAAAAKGIKIIAYDAPLTPDARLIRIAGADPGLTGRALFELAAAAAPEGGDIALLSAEPGAETQARTLDAFRAALAAQTPAESDDPPALRLAATASGEDTPDKNYDQVRLLVRTYPRLKLLVAATPTGLAAACRAIEQQGRIGRTAAVGPGRPSELRNFVRSGACAGLISVNPGDMGYAAAYAAVEAVRGERMEPEARLRLGRVGNLQIDSTRTAYLGAPQKFGRANIDNPAAAF